MQKPRVLLVDLDNCPNQMGNLEGVLDEFTRVIICHGKSQPKVPLGLVTSLASVIHSGKLEIVGMDNGGKNAADFALTFWAGRLVAEMPDETEFYVVSKDADLNHVIYLLKAAGREAKRIDGSGKELKLEDGELAAEKNGKVSEELGVDCFNRLGDGKAKPAKRTSLKRSITTYFQKIERQIDVNAIVAEMEHPGFVTFKGASAHYTGKLDTYLDEGVPF